MEKMKNNKWRRIPILMMLTFALLITACLAVLPMTVSAAEGELTVTEAVDSDGDGYVEIDTAEKLWWFTQQVNTGSSYSRLNAVLTANIDLSGTCGEGIGNWLPIGNSYSGHFNGQGYTISNLYMTGNEQYAGLFGYVKGATIENVTVTGSVSSTFYSTYDENYNFFDGAAGGVVAHLDGGTIRTCESDVTVTGGLNFGGICGQLSSGIIEDCINRGTIIRDLDSMDVVYYGGIVGYMDGGTVRGCINQGADIVGTNAEIGGIVGQVAEGTVENCINLSNIATTQNASVGGIVGKLWIYGAIRNCGNYGIVTGDEVGGITGVNEGDIEHCWNIASVSGTSEYVGPIAGYISTYYGNITNNYYLSATTTEDGGRTAEQFASGQVAYELNGSTTADDSVWKQTLETDDYPTLTGEFVYYITPKMCNGTELEPIYSNSSEIVYHDDTNDDSFCDLCDWLIISEKTFPDETFRNIILSAEFDLDQDGLLSPEEIAQVTYIYFDSVDLSDLTGIRYFTSLEKLEMQGGYNLVSLDLSGLSKLKSLFLEQNYNLESLNLTGCTALRMLYLTNCSDLTTLNIQDCVALQYLDLSSCSNLVDSLKVGHLTELLYLSVEGIWLCELDLSNNTKLEELLIQSTGITWLDLSNTAVYRLEGSLLSNIEHCGVGYVNMNELVDDTSKIVSVTGGTLGEDGWLKLDDDADEFIYEYVTGAEGCNLFVTIGFIPSYAEQHTYVANTISKDATHHYTEWCETCHTGNEESVTEHTYEEIVRADFAKTPATCTTGTIYYKSCECGKTSDETFEDDDRNSENHTGTNDKLVPNGVLHHNVVWSCCGAVVTENVTCTASNADGSCLTAETCVCGNQLIAAKPSHELTYTASGNVITETCGREGCAHTATATLYAPENPVYNGTQKLATVTYSDDWKGDDLMVGYSGTANDGSSYAGIVYPAVKAGTVTASITAQSDDYTVATANVTYTIQKAPVTVGIISVESPEAIYPHTALGSIVLTRTNTTIPGTLALNAGQTLTVGTQEYNWTWTPDDANNYKETKGTISITVTKATPTADIFDFTPPENFDVCDGLAKEATVTVKEAIEGVGSVTVKYFKDGVELTGAPTTVGTYTVKIEVAEGANFLASKGFLTDASWTFTFDVTDEADHTGVTLISNGNGTHDKFCTVCAKVIESGITCSGTTTDDCDKGYKCSCGGYFGTKEHNFTIPGKDSNDHWNECSDCGAIDEKIKHSATEDGDCTTEEKCSCGTIVIEAKNDHGFDNSCDTTCGNPGCTHTREITHTPRDDDGDCTTDIHCSICDAITTKGNASHTDIDEDLRCDLCDSYCGLFEQIHISLGEDMTVYYYVANCTLTTPQMRFTINGYTKTVDGILQGEQFKFVFDGVAPQWIGDTIKAELIIGGEVVEVKEYSVLRYLNSLKSKTAAELGYTPEKYDAMVTLINDLLVYGGAAQNYTGHKTDALVSEGITGSTFEMITDTDTAGDPTGKAVTFTGMNVHFNNTNRLMFRFSAQDLTGVTFTVQVNNGPEQEIGYTASGDYFIIMTDAIKAIAFDDVYTITAYKDGVIDATLTYSIKSYVYSKQGGTNSLSELAKATYNYGLSAKAFARA